MTWTIKVRSDAKDKWHNLADDAGIVFASKEEAEQARTQGLAMIGGEAEIECVECGKPATVTTVRAHKAG